MQQLTARITKDATVKTFDSGRSVVNFNVAYNDSYRNKDGEKKVITQFYQCSYWLTAKVAPYLTKGRLVQLFGTISAKAYEDQNGKPQAALQLKASRIIFHDASKKAEATTAGVETGQPDDLPF